MHLENLKSMLLAQFRVDWASFYVGRGSKEVKAEDYTFRLAHLMIRNMLSSERAYCGFLDKRQAHSMSLVFGPCWRIRPGGQDRECLSRHQSAHCRCFPWHHQSVQAKATKRRKLTHKRQMVFNNYFLSNK